MENILDFKNKIINLYIKYPIIKEILEDKDYLKFLYCHLNETEVILTKEMNEQLENNSIMKTKIQANTSFSNNINLIYHKYLTDDEKNIILLGNFYVYVVSKEYPDHNNENEEFFNLKNRRDFLLPMLFHKNTIESFSKFKITNLETYKERKKQFFKLLVNIRKYVSTMDRLGTMLDSSITLNIFDIRKNNDTEIVILHPRIDDINVRFNLENFKKINNVNPYIDNIIEWKDNDKTKLDKMISENTDGMITDYHMIVFNPKYHFYFFGIKVITLELDLKQRAKRRYPKNIAELIIAKEKLNVNVPKIKKLESNMIVQDNIYDQEKFIQVVSKYLNRFEHDSTNIKEKIEDLY